jgi:hypothetical protein
MLVVVGTISMYVCMYVCFQLVRSSMVAVLLVFAPRADRKRYAATYRLHPASSTYMAQNKIALINAHKRFCAFP